MRLISWGDLSSFVSEVVQQEEPGQAHLNWERKLYCSLTISKAVTTHAYSPIRIFRGDIPLIKLYSDLDAARLLDTFR